MILYLRLYFAGVVDVVSRVWFLLYANAVALCSDYDDVEEILRQFDMNMAYGPSLGITRLERFERSQRLGLNPPLHVKDVLERMGGKPHALWEGRV